VNFLLFQEKRLTLFFSRIVSLKLRKEMMMKRLGMLGLMIWVSASVFALTETWNITGFEWGNFFEDNHASGNTFLSGPGLTLSAYSFRDRRDSGIFAHISVLFPVFKSSDGDATRPETDIANLDSVMQFGFIMGPGFRYHFNERLKLMFGFGFELMDRVAWSREHDGDTTTQEYTNISFNMGVGGDIGVKYDFTDKLFLSAGAAISVDFLTMGVVSAAYSPDGKSRTADWIDAKIAASIRPYIAIGFNTYYEQPAVFGKPQ
jgi:hypothetical protein